MKEKKPWNKKKKVIVGVIALFFIFGAFGSSGEKKKTEDSKEPESIAVAVNKETPNPEKSDMVNSDEKIWEIVLSSENDAKVLIEGCNVVGEGGGTTLELYNLAKKAKDNQSSYYSALNNLSNEYTKAYVKSAQDYTINAKIIAEKIMKYIDKNEMKYLSEASERITQTETYTINIVAERMSYLAKCGLTDEEIQSQLGTENQ